MSADGIEIASDDFTHTVKCRDYVLPVSSSNAEHFYTSITGTLKQIFYIVSIISSKLSWVLNFQADPVQSQSVSKKHSLIEA